MARGGTVIDRLFQLTAHNTTVRTEIVAGITTFLAMAYIIFVQPAVLSAAGMDFGAVMVATCLASALATLLMGLLANYPIAVAPAMGHNFYFAFTVCVSMQVPWQIALGAVAIAGLIFILTATVGLRERLIVVIPTSLKHAMAVGIGLLVVGILLARGIPGALLIGMLASTVAGLATGLVRYQGVIGAPPSISPTLLQLNLTGALSGAMVPVILIFFFLALFDSVGTLVGVASHAGLLRGGTLPRARQALLADAVGTVTGAALGTSTVTAYIESSTGVAAGGRTGLANVVTATLFLLSLFFHPLVKMIGGGYAAGGNLVLYPVVAPALILVGTLMIGSVREIAWDDLTEAIPAFLTMILMPLTVSITEGIAWGFIAYAVLKLATGRSREAHPLVYLFAGLFIARYVWL
jgi:AGZA family xanthine/uracil permease-like MFS transporter